ncbi:cysteine-rich protein 2-binding protein-like [Oratosquilla oratoria]|uniref:cysteine-rich protein 2-binding protein-like n=1 Tax=Oratosquilla oratoria TaxID=337810 RepID=UPI003F7613C0
MVDTDIVRRANLSITQLLLLTLYNLHMKNPAGHRKGFFHWKLDIYKFILQHWNDLFVDKRLKREERIRGTILAHLSCYPHFFVGGHDLLNDGGWYKLCQVLPPAVLLHQEVQKIDRNTNQGGPTTKKARCEEGNITDRFPVEGVYVKKEVEEVSGNKSSCGLQYLEKDILKPHASLPNSIYEDYYEQEEVKVEEEIKVEEEHLEDFSGDFDVGQTDTIVGDLLPPPLEESLFIQKKNTCFKSTGRSEGRR